MYQALYRKYRPKNFDEVIGQEVIVKTLKNTIEKNKISHAYLFTGPRGTGKTSAAKIFAKTINCQQLINNIPCENCDCCKQFNNQQNIDIIEIDAASNNGVDEIRELKNKVNLVPSISKYKVYIIDEVHMLSTSAFNALLKTLEEPPGHVIFILATTDPHKVLPTILSRCQRFDFKKVSENKIYERLKYISEQENIEIEQSALKEISRLANGGLRDALSILDQVIAYSDSKITEDEVHEVNGTITQEHLKQIVLSLTNNSLLEIFSIIDNYDNNGKNFLKLTEELILFYKNILLIKKIPNYLENNNLYQDFVDLYEEEKLLQILNELNSTLNNIKNNNNSRLVFELTIIKILNINKNELNPINSDNRVENKNILIKEDIKKTEKRDDLNIDTNQEAKLKELQDIRINNTLSKLNKKEIINFREKCKGLNTKLLDPDCGEFVSMILDGELKAASDEYLVFVFKTQNITKIFNLSIVKIEKFLNSEFNTNYKIIGVEQQQWDLIKEEFNNKTKKFEYKEEKIDLLEIFPNNENKNLDSSIDSMFKNIVEYN
ncbi:MAG: DNA polymerase III subunit gamma/tau [Bacilli bacterium]|nr:DNA polymerase III subunit gamma/tau [Bacilli bacterium]